MFTTSDLIDESKTTTTWLIVGKRDGKWWDCWDFNSYLEAETYLAEHQDKLKRVAYSEAAIICKTTTQAVKTTLHKNIEL